MQNFFLRPIVGADGNAVPVPDPSTGEYLKAAGEWKPKTVYWLRRVMFGDAVEADPNAAAPAVATPAPVRNAVPSFDAAAAGQGRAAGELQADT